MLLACAGIARLENVNALTHAEDRAQLLANACSMLRPQADTQPVLGGIARLASFACILLRGNGASNIDSSNCKLSKGTEVNEQV